MKFNWLIFKILLLIIGLGFLVAFSHQRFDNREINDVQVKIDYSSGNHFVTSNLVENILSKTHPDFPKMELKRVSIPKMEKELRNYSFIKEAEVYLENDGNLFAIVEQETPVARVNFLNDKYYITEEGDKIPLSDEYSAKVLLINGSIIKEEFMGISNLIQAINADKLLKNLVIGIRKEKVNSFILLTQDDEFVIEVGDLNDIKLKMENFNVFYNQFLINHSVQPYKKISLKFKNQIVATK